MATPRLSSYETERRIAVLKKNCGFAPPSAQELGISIATLASFISNLPVDTRKELAAMRSKGNPSKVGSCGNSEELKRLLEEAKADAETSRKALAAREAADAGTAAEWEVKAIKINPKDDALVPIVVFSDWHLGEEVLLSDVPNGCNQYNEKIARQRAQNLTTRAVWMIKNSGAMISQDLIVLALIGDFITGWIHDELMAGAKFSPLEEIELATEVLTGVIQYFLDNTKAKRIVIPTCHGNHGRNTHKMFIKGSARTSYEHFMYRALSRHFAKEDRLEFVISESYTAMVNIGEIRVRLHHGDGIKSGGGIGGIGIPLNKWIHRANMAYRADLDVIGHFHQLLDGGNHVTNGSAIGYSSYAAKLGCPYEPPRQALVLVHPRRGKSGTLPIWGD